MNGVVLRSSNAVALLSLEGTKLKVQTKINIQVSVRSRESTASTELLLLLLTVVESVFESYSVRSFDDKAATEVYYETRRNGMFSTTLREATDLYRQGQRTLEGTPIGRLLPELVLDFETKILVRSGLLNM